MAIYITSDWHFCHDKEFCYGPRGFKSPGEMNEAIINKFNSIVTDEDDVYVLGDEIMSDMDKGISCINRLNGKLHYIRGNHTTDNKIDRIKNETHNFAEYCGYATIIHYKHYRFYLSHYPTITSNSDEDKPLKSRTINLCGHTHTSDKFKHMSLGLIYHCEVDAHNCCPVNIEKIIEDLKKETTDVKF